MASQILVNIGLGYGLTPVKYNVITLTNVDTKSIRILGMYFNKILFDIEILHLTDTLK